jgi:hypothetical protein
MLSLCINAVSGVRSVSAILASARVQLCYYNNIIIIIIIMVIIIIHYDCYNYVVLLCCKQLSLVSGSCLLLCLSMR